MRKVALLSLMPDTKLTISLDRSTNYKVSQRKQTTQTLINFLEERLLKGWKNYNIFGDIFRNFSFGWGRMGRSETESEIYTNG